MLSVEFPVILDCFRSKASFHKQVETFQCPVNLDALYDTANFCKSVLVLERSVSSQKLKKETLSGQKLKKAAHSSFLTTLVGDKHTNGQRHK